MFEAYQRWQRELEREPVEFLARRWEGLLAEAREELARYVGARARRWIETGFVAYSAIAFLAISFGTSLLPTSISFDVPAGSVGLSRVAFEQELRARGIAVYRPGSDDLADDLAALDRLGTCSESSNCSRASSR